MQQRLQLFLPQQAKSVHTMWLQQHLLLHDATATQNGFQNHSVWQHCHSCSCSCTVLQCNPIVAAKKKKKTQPLPHRVNGPYGVIVLKMKKSSSHFNSLLCHRTKDACTIHGVSCFCKTLNVMLLRLIMTR